MLDSRDVVFIMDAHSNHPREPKKAVRKWDGRTSYFAHPLWCATTILTEYSLSELNRREGAQALLYHDVLEDTTASLPGWLSPRVVDLVQGMTFESNDREMDEVWNRPAIIRLLKLYDKVSNMLDSSWMGDDKRDKYVSYIARLAQDVQANYGTRLHILRFAIVIINEPR